MARCAVVGCRSQGLPQICPYDGRYHHHGRIHYDCPRAQPTALEFYQDEWDLLCDEHYGVLTSELLTREGEKALSE